MKYCKAFTLIEMMVVIAIVAVLLGLAVPSFMSIINENKVVTMANELISDLNYARIESIKQSDVVSVCPSSDKATCTGGGNWSSGWIIFNDPNQTGSLELGETILRVNGNGAGGLSLTTADATYVQFNSQGRVKVSGLDHYLLKYPQPIWIQALSKLFVVQPAYGSSSSSDTCNNGEDSVVFSLCPQSSFNLPGRKIWVFGTGRICVSSNSCISS